DQTGKIGVEALGSDAGGGSLSILNGEGDQLARVEVTDGKGRFAVSERAHVVASLSSNESGAGHLTLSDQQGRPGLEAEADASAGGGGGLSVSNKEGLQVATVGAGTDGQGRFVVVDKANNLAELTAN